MSDTTAPFPSNRGDYPGTTTPIPTKLSDLVNDVGYMTAAQMVQQVNYAIGTPYQVPNSSFAVPLNTALGNYTTNLANYGAVGDGVTDNTAAIMAASAVSDPAGVYVPAGIYYTTNIPDNALNGKFIGPGQIVTNRSRPPFNENHIQAPYRVSIIEPITNSLNSFTPVSWRSSYRTNYSGWPPYPVDAVSPDLQQDISYILFPINYNIYDINGQHTLGNPTGGYLWLPEASAFLMRYSNFSGWNQSVSSNDGRTGVAAIKIYLLAQGNGDTAAYNAEVTVNGNNPGAEHFLANPAGIVINADIVAGAAGVYLNAAEHHISDNGYDCAAIGHVINLNRTNNTGALYCVWFAERLQSQGSVPVDAFISCAGKSNVGIDLVTANLGTNQAAVVLAPNQRIYLAGVAGTATPPLVNFINQPGNIWFEYDAATSKIVFGNGTTRIFSVDGSGNATFKGTVTQNGSP